MPRVCSTAMSRSGLSVGITCWIWPENKRYHPWMSSYFGKVSFGWKITLGDSTSWDPRKIRTWESCIQPTMFCHVTSRCAHVPSLLSWRFGIPDPGLLDKHRWPIFSDEVAPQFQDSGVEAGFRRRTPELSEPTVPNCLFKRRRWVVGITWQLAKSGNSGFSHH